MPELADVLSARLLAVDMSTRQGWAMARHLEVFCEEDTGSVPQHALLSVQKHARQVERGDWGGDVKGKNKFKDGKGKGKKGKGKGKGKGGWNNWSPENREKGGEKAKKGEGET